MPNAYFATAEEIEALKAASAARARAALQDVEVPEEDEPLTASGPTPVGRLVLVGGLYVLAFLAMDVSLSGWLLKSAMGPEHGRGLVLWGAAGGAPAMLALAALRTPRRRRKRLYAAAAFLASGALALLSW